MSGGGVHWARIVSGPTCVKTMLDGAGVLVRPMLGGSGSLRGGVVTLVVAGFPCRSLLLGGKHVMDCYTSPKLWTSIDLRRRKVLTLTKML